MHRSHVLVEISQLIEKNVDELMAKWLVMFDDELVLKNTKKLVDHVENFMEEINDETADRQERIRQNIKGLNARF